MVRILISILLLANSLVSFSQTFAAAEELNLNLGLFDIHFSKSDNKGNTYYAVELREPLILNGNTYSPACNPNAPYYNICGHDILIIKVNSSKVTEWVYQLGSFNDDSRRDTPTALHIDSTGNVYLAASLYGTSLVAGKQDYPDMNNCLVILSPNGKTKKIQALGVRVNDIHVDKNFNIFLTGSTTNEDKGMLYFFDGNTDDYSTNSNLFTARLDSSLAIKWTNKSSLTKTPYSYNLKLEGTGFIKDRNGKLYLLGHLMTSYDDTLNIVHFDSIAYQSRLASYYNETLILEINAETGKFETLLPGFNYMRSACFDIHNNLVVWGNGKVNNKVVKLNYNGSYFLKIKDFSLLTGQKLIPGEAHEIVTNEAGEFFITGKFSNFISFEPGISLTTSAEIDYLAKIDADSKVSWAIKIAAVWSPYIPLRYTGNGEIEYTGSISSDKVFGKFIISPKAGGTVILKIKDNTIVTGNNSQSGSDELKVLVYPNPGSGNLKIQAEQELKELVISNLFGQPVFSVKPNAFNFDISHSLPKGNYILNIKFQDKTYNQMISVQ